MRVEMLAVLAQAPPPVVYEPPSKIAAAIALVVGYLIGSIMVGLLITRRKAADPREGGDYTPDPWNVKEHGGRGPMIWTLLGDLFKGFIAGSFGYALAAELGAITATAGAMIGHTFPAYHKFKGGGRPFLPFAGGTLALLNAPGPFGVAWFISFELFFILWLAFSLRVGVAGGFGSLPIWQLLIAEPDKVAVGTVFLLLLLAGGWYWVHSKRHRPSELKLRLMRAERRAKIADKRAEQAEEKRGESEEAQEEARRIAEEAERLAIEAREDAQMAERKVEEEHEPDVPEEREEAEEARQTADDARQKARELAGGG